jgi:hypothetical protein
MPLDAIASATARIFFSSMLHENAFHEFQPIGGNA